MEDDPRARLMDALRAAAKASSEQQAEAAANSAGIDAEAHYRDAVEGARAIRFVHEINSELQDLGPRLPEIVGRAVGGIPTAPSHTNNVFHVDHHDEVMEYRVSQMTIRTTACRGSVSAVVNRVADGAVVFTRELGPPDLLGENYRESMAGLAHDFVVRALGL